MTARLLNIKLEKIYLYPLGGISKLNIPINYSHLKELLIILSGPLFQILTNKYLGIIFPQNQNLINTYHQGILIFNLLPVYSLDGGKIINLVLSKLIPYKKSLNLSILISYLTIVVFFFLNIPNIKINIITITIFLIMKTTQEKNKIKIYYEKLLLEKKFHKKNYKYTKLIKKSTDFYRNKHHIILENDKYYLENEYLEKKYNFF